jgi:large subunit ribosomal protein L13
LQSQISKRYKIYFKSIKITVVDTLSYKTKSAKKEEVEHKWFIIDADNQVVGRIASQIAAVLRGKHKPNYTPHVDTGDNVIIINAGKVRFTGNKWDQKYYLRYSGYPGGQKKTFAKELLAKKPDAVIQKAVKGMLPKNILGRAMARKLYIYTGEEHPHAAQKPVVLEF